MSNPNARLQYFQEDPNKFIHEDSPLVRKINQRKHLYNWYQSTFLTAVRASVQNSLNKYFSGNIEQAISVLKNGKRSKKLWEAINDDLREVISEVPRANLVFGKENIEKALIHDSADGLNELVKLYVNACLLLIKESQSALNLEETPKKTEIPLTKKARLEFRKLNIKDQKYILEKWNLHCSGSLCDILNSPHVKKLTDIGAYRLKIANFRLMFTVDDGTIEIYHVLIKGSVKRRSYRQS